jgi:predicted dehydrogenase
MYNIAIAAMDGRSGDPAQYPRIRASAAAGRASAEARQTAGQKKDMSENSSKRFKAVWSGQGTSPIPPSCVAAHPGRRDRRDLRPRIGPKRRRWQSASRSRSRIRWRRCAPPGADVIHVLTPPHTHAAVASEAPARRLPRVRGEAAGDRRDECVKLRDLAKAQGREVCVCHSLLWDPQVKSALEAVRAGKLGDVVAVDILRGSLYPPVAGAGVPPQYRTAGYPFRDLGIHALYVIEAFLGPIEKVDAQWRSGGGDPNLAFNDWRALVTCKKGMGQVQLSWGVRPLQHQIVIQGDQGRAAAGSVPDVPGVAKADAAAQAGRAHRERADGFDPAAGRRSQERGGVRAQADPPVPRRAGADHRLLPGAGEGGRRRVSVDDALSAVRWTEEVARAADRDDQQSVAKFALSPSVPYAMTGASGGLGSALLERLKKERVRVRILRPALPEKAERRDRIRAR